MVVQTIQISFSSYAADTIRIHTGETGREILFAPDMEISGNYSADFIIIKPDDTFAIAAATITEGKIIVEIPEQAGAVAGAGHYILKIYDSGEVCIYSASGGFMVDDHLLSDGMIESVAEAYGYRFPQDFAVIDDDITALDKTWSSEKIAGMIDDDNILYGKTWSSEKISYELGNVHGFHVYTTTEQPVGRWVDGKTLYEITVSGEFSSPNVMVSSIYTGYFDISSLGFVNIVFVDVSNSYIIKNNVKRGFIGGYAEPERNRLIMITYYQQSSVTAYITIRYTKNE